MADEYFEFEASWTRSEIATHLRAIADELDGDGEITFSSGNRTISVTPPERSWFELEVERGRDEAEIEIEIEWDRAAESELAVESVGTDEQAQSESTTSPDGSAAFEIYEDSAGKWRFRLVHDGRILANSSGGQESQEEAELTIETVRQVAADAEIKAE